MTNEEWAKLPPYMRNNLLNEGLTPTNLSNVPTKGQPYTNVGVMNSPEYQTKLPAGTRGVTFRPENTANSDRSSLRLYDSKEDPKGAAITRAHETEHALANQARGSGSSLNGMWADMTKNEDVDSSRGAVVQRLVEHAPYLMKKWGLPAEDVKNGYFSKIVLDRPDAHNFLAEQLATLSAMEQGKQKRFVEDPYVRKNILKTPAEREAYEALTGLRQTRLDAKDLPPYTRQPGSTSIPSDSDNAGFMDTR